MASANEVRSITPNAAERWRGLALLAFLSAVYLAFLALSVPRMNNYVMSDREFTGWTGPIAERLVRGERPYIDFVLPIPPGSLLVLASIQKVMGRALLLQELWVAAVSHWLMGLVAYWMASRLTSRRIALLVAAGTLVLVTQTPKECVYDHTSQLCAWLSLAVGLEAMLARGRFQRPLWFATGLLASLTLLFKQSTATGIVLGWALAVSYLVFVRWREEGRPAALDPARQGVFCFAGGVAGLLLVALALFAVGTTPGAFVQAIFRDAPELKGGGMTLLKNLFKYVTEHDAVRNALVPTVIAIFVGIRAAQKEGTHLGAEPGRPASLGLRPMLLLVLGFALTFGVACGLLLAEVRLLNRTVTANIDTLRLIPGYGFGFAIVYFVTHLLRDETDVARRRIGHVFNAFAIVAMTSSLVYNTSFIHFSPFYYNNPDIPLALLALFIALERTRLPWLTVAVAAVCALPVYGIKLNRALSADTSVSAGHWAGMRVNYRGVELLRAVNRVHELTTPRDSVLVLPEDVQLAGLIGRPRPPVRGAVLFVDQYARRLLAEDIRSLDRNLPKVIVIHPRRRRDWHTLYNTWSKNSAAKEVIDHVIDDLLPKYYRLDSSYRTIYFWDQGQLDLWVQKERVDSPDGSQS